MKDHIARYGLEFDPFLKNAKYIPVKTAEAGEARIRLDYLGNTGGFGVLTGEPGNGKTTAGREWRSSLNPSLFKTSYNTLSTLTVMDFYRQIASGLGAEPSFRKNELFNNIQHEIKRYALEKRVTPVIIIDEADKLSHKILSDLQIMFNFEMDSRDLAVVLLVGQPRLNVTLNQGIHESLRQRIVMNYHMGGISKEEGRIYISRKLEGAGCHQTVFDTNATEAILNHSNGTLRMINKICTRSMVVGSSQGKSIIDADTAQKAIEDIQLG